MGQNLEKLNKLIKNSELSLKEQIEFLNLFAKVPDQDLNQVIEFFVEEPSWIKKIFDNYIKKKKALAENNETAWQEILKQEIEDLEKIG